MAGEDRTEAATPRRLARAREEGRVAVSREAALLAGLGAGTLALLLLGPGLATEAARALSTLIAAPDGRDPGRAGWEALALFARLVLPVAAAALAAGIGATLLQTGMTPRPAALRPDFGRVSPRAGLRRLFGPDTLADTARAMVKVVAAALLLRALAASGLDAIAAASWREPAAIGPALIGLLRPMLWAILGVQVAAALADLAWVRHRHARSLRMTREEVRQDFREAEGDPKIKARRRQLRLARHRRRMAQAIARATVVITNPTHYAVALAYDRSGPAAPRVVAKGMDHMAARIRDLAREHRVPLVANPPLARALHRVEIDAEIPREHFQAVAEIIAYVWRLRRQARP